MIFSPPTFAYQSFSILVFPIVSSLYRLFLCLNDWLSYYGFNRNNNNVVDSRSPVSMNDYSVHHAILYQDRKK